MKAYRQFFCELCSGSARLRADADSIPPCPHCHRRDTLVLVNAPSGAPVTPEVARKAFAAMREAITVEPANE